MMIGILMIAMAALQVEPGEPGVQVTTLPTARLDIPDEIAPAVVPYMGCLLAASGVRVRGQLDPRPPGIGKGGDCLPARDRAAKDSEALLKRNGKRTPEERTAFIEATLLSVERFSNSTGAVTPPQVKPNAKN